MLSSDLFLHTLFLTDRLAGWSIVVDEVMHGCGEKDDDVVMMSTISDGESR
jgi:hypothetical protein